MKKNINMLIYIWVKKMNIDYFLNEMIKKVDYLGIYVDSISIKELDKIHKGKL